MITIQRANINPNTLPTACTASVLIPAIANWYWLAVVVGTRSGLHAGNPFESLFEPSGQGVLFQIALQKSALERLALVKLTKRKLAPERLALGSLAQERSAFGPTRNPLIKFQSVGSVGDVPLPQPDRMPVRSTPVRLAPGMTR